MKKLKSLIDICKIKVFHGGKCPLLAGISADYKNFYGLKHSPFTYDGAMSGDIGKIIADEYEKLDHLPDSPLVKAAYDQLAIELMQQFDFLNQREAVKYEAYTGNGEPYKSSFEMLADFHSYHLYFFKTSSGFGEAVHHLDSKMLEKTGIVYDGYELVINDIFRIVHDIFGHAMNGYEFGPIGEDLAWFTHISMFSPLAASALTMETRGQNCWVNFGRHMRDKYGKLVGKDAPSYIPPKYRPFAEQKMNILPSNISGVEVRDDGMGNIQAEFLPIWDPILYVNRSTPQMYQGNSA